MTDSAICDIVERSRTEEASRISKKRFRVVLDSSPVVVFNRDLVPRYTWINSPCPSPAKLCKTVCIGERQFCR